MLAAPPKPDVPIAKAADLPQYDGIIFGAPTRFGMVAGEVSLLRVMCIRGLACLEQSVSWVLLVEGGR